MVFTISESTFQTNTYIKLTMASGENIFTKWRLEPNLFCGLVDLWTDYVNGYKQTNIESKKNVSTKCEITSGINCNINHLRL